MALGEISVQVVPDLSKFLEKLTADLRKAGANIDKSTERVAESVEDSFRDAGQTIERTFDGMRRDADSSLDGIARSAETNSEKIERSFRDAANDSEKALGGIGGGFAGLGTKLAGALAAFGIGSFLKDATLEAEAANAALRTTVQLIESTGNKAGVSISQIEQLSKDLLFKIGIDDTDVIRASNVLLTFTGVTGDIFEETITRAADLQAVFGTDLSGAAMQLGKALNDPIRGINALRRSGVSFTKEQTEQIKVLVASGKTAEAQRLILDELARQFGGTAEASASASTRIGAFFGELKESAGAGLLPVIERLAPTIISLLQTLQGPMEQIGAMFGEFLEPLLEVLAGVLPSAVQIFGSVLTVIGATIKALAPIITPLVEILAQMADVFARVFVDLLKMAEPLIAFFVETIGNLADIVLPVLFGIFEKLAPIIGEVLGIIGRLAQRIMPVLLRILEKIAPVLGDFFLVAVESLVPVFEAVEQAIIKLAPDLAKLGDVFITVVKTLTPVLPVLANGLIRVLNALMPLIPPLVELIEILLPPLVELFAALVPLLVDGVGWAFENVIVPALKVVLAALKPVVIFVAGLAKGFDLLIGPANTLGELFSRIWDGIVETVRIATDKIKGFISGVASFFIQVWRGLKAIGQGLFDGIVGTFRAVVNGILIAVEAGLNFLIRGLNKAIDVVDKAAGPLFDFGEIPEVKIPKIGMANGGIVTSPTFAQIGEAGPEAVIPLTRPRRAAAILEQAGLAAAVGGATVQIDTANFYDGTDAQLVAQKVYAAVSLGGQT